MTLTHLNKVFEKAIADNNKYVAIAVKNGIQHDPEIIINLTTNFRSKLNYYNKAYKNSVNTDELELINNPNIKIVGIEKGNNPVVLLKKLGSI